MRIAHVLHRFLPRYPGGTEVYAGRLGRSLAARGHTLSIFTGDPDSTAPQTYLWEGLPVQAVPWRAGQAAGPVSTFLAGFGNRPVERRFAAFLAEHRPDVVHVHHLLGLSPRLPGLAARRGARVVITLHDYWFRCANTFLYRYDNQQCPGPGWGYHCGGCALQRLGRAPQPGLMALAAPIFVARTQVLRGVLRQAHALIAPSTLAAEAMADDAALKDRVAVVPHGLADSTAPLSAALPEVPHPPRLACIGPLIPPKGVHIIIEAFNELPAAEAELHLYGDARADPGYTERLRQAVRRAGVYFHGRSPHAQVLNDLARTDLLLAPTLMRETYSLIVDEAQALGVPVLISSHTAAAGRIEPEVNGLHAPPGDVAAWLAQMRRAVDEPGLLRRLRTGARAPRTLEAHTTAIERVYAQVLQGGA